MLKHTHDLYHPAFDLDPSLSPSHVPALSPFPGLFRSVVPFPHVLSCHDPSFPCLHALTSPKLIVYYWKICANHAR